jgi:CRP-like cAMP-binding protein
MVRVLRGGADETAREIATLGPGDFFGEHALLYAAPRNASVVAISAARVWSLTSLDFDDLLRHYLHHDDLLQTVARERIEATPPVRVDSARFATAP